MADIEYICKATGEIITFRRALGWAADVTAGLRTTNSPTAVEWNRDRSVITCEWFGVMHEYTRLD